MHVFAIVKLRIIMENSHTDDTIIIIISRRRTAYSRVIRVVRVRADSANASNSELGKRNKLSTSLPITRKGRSTTLDRGEIILIFPEARSKTVRGCTTNDDRLKTIYFFSLYYRSTEGGREF